MSRTIEPRFSQSIGIVRREHSRHCADDSMPTENPHPCRRFVVWWQNSTCFRGHCPAGIVKNIISNVFKGGAINYLPLFFFLITDFSEFTDSFIGCATFQNVFVKLNEH